MRQLEVMVELNEMVTTHYYPIDSNWEIRQGWIYVTKKTFDLVLKFEKQAVLACYRADRVICIRPTGDDNADGETAPERDPGQSD